ncbi:hypothetical protein FLP41_14335 [Paracoccus marcusii]|uniref:hypothetical protein n=1 Tax=Paracoccus marcusii TaxID=59779 RepID=UPI002ED5947B|nr:hypothetical protein FLP41_14335 [Paracoccus marcusii]
MIDLNDIAAPKTRHDLAAVKERLACTAADWLPGLFPEARLARDRRSLRCADLSGRPPRKEGSCTIHLDGPYAGWGFDYATGERAGPIDLIALATGLCNGALFDEAARLAGMDHPAPRHAPAAPCARARIILPRSHVSSTGPFHSRARWARPICAPAGSRIPGRPT